MDDAENRKASQGSRLGAFMGEAPLQSQPTPGAKYMAQEAQIAIIRNP
jgi:hypothetical protein